MLEIKQPFRPYKDTNFETVVYFRMNGYYLFGVRGRDPTRIVYREGSEDTSTPMGN